MRSTLAILLLLATPAMAAEPFCYRGGLQCDCATGVCEGSTTSRLPIVTPGAAADLPSCEGDECFAPPRSADGRILIDGRYGAPIALPADEDAARMARMRALGQR